MKKRINDLLNLIGLLKYINKCRYIVKRKKDYRAGYKVLEKQSASTKKRFEFKWSERRAYLFDNSPKTWYDRHYIIHPSWAARVLKEISPSKHIDISSKLYFSTITSAFIPFEFYDYRPAEINLTNLKVGSEDLTDLTFEDNTVESISCMHTLEHIGLGRYGDQIDYDGDLKAISELCRVVKIGGSLLVVAPIGKINKIIFNAHRIYNSDEFISYFEKNNMTLKQYALIPDNKKDGDLVISPSEELKNRQEYGCGCFWFIKQS